MKNPYIEERRLKERLKMRMHVLVNLVNSSYLCFNSLLLFITV